VLVCVEGRRLGQTTVLYCTAQYSTRPGCTVVVLACVCVEGVGCAQQIIVDTRLLVSLAVWCGCRTLIAEPCLQMLFAEPCLQNPVGRTLFGKHHCGSVRAVCWQRSLLGFLPPATLLSAREKAMTLQLNALEALSWENCTCGSYRYFSWHACSLSKQWLPLQQLAVRSKKLVHDATLCLTKSYPVVHGTKILDGQRHSPNTLSLQVHA
jgi:hypothetical protein